MFSNNIVTSINSQQSLFELAWLAVVRESRDAKSRKEVPAVSNLIFFSRLYVVVAVHIAKHWMNINCCVKCANLARECFICLLFFVRVLFYFVKSYKLQFFETQSRIRVSAEEELKIVL